MSSRDEALKACPLVCGGVGEVHTTGEDGDGDYFVSCNRCCITTSAYATEAEAIATWNRRAPSAEPFANGMPRLTPEVVGHLRMLTDFAYQHGYHELGYDPVAVVERHLALSRPFRPPACPYCGDDIESRPTSAPSEQPVPAEYDRESYLRGYSKGLKDGARKSIPEQKPADVGAAEPATKTPGQQLYEDMSANLTAVHCNRMPAWHELKDWQRADLESLAGETRG